MAKDARTTSGVSGQDTVVDNVVVASLRDIAGDTDRGRNSLVRLVTIFLDDAQRRMGELVTAVGAGDAAAVSSLSHSLVGSSASLGAVAVADCCRMIEADARAGDLRHVVSVVAQLRQAFTATEEILRREFLRGAGGAITR